MHLLGLIVNYTRNDAQNMHIEHFAHIFLCLFLKTFTNRNEKKFFFGSNDSIKCFNCQRTESTEQWIF